VSEHDRVPPLGELKATRREVRDRPTPAPARDSDAGSVEYDLLLRESPARAVGMAQQMLAILVRVLGLCFLVIGIGAAVIILHEAWTLYKEPARIEPFAVAIEQGSNLDKIFAPSASEATSEGEAASHSDFRLSYFAGWFLVLLLMLVGSIVAVSAVSAGGRLVLYDTDIRRLSRAVIREVRRNKGN
jgi:uncharacterized membrane protein